MPKINHDTLGDVQQHVYLQAVVKKRYLASPDIPEEQWDTLDITLDEGGEYPGCPAFYHCSPGARERLNGAIEDGARAFLEGDRVLVLARLAKEKLVSFGSVMKYDEVTVIGFSTGPRRCSFGYVLVRLSTADFLSLDGPFGETTYDPITETWSYEDFEPGSHSGELCILYDHNLKGFAQVRSPRDNYESLVSFPCTVEELKPVIETLPFCDVELFDYYPQGDTSFPWATGAVYWGNDISGEDLGVNTIGYELNDVQQMFQDFRWAFLADDQGFLDGKFEALYEKVYPYLIKEIPEWAEKSEGFQYDSRFGYPVTGPHAEPEDGLPEQGVLVSGRSAVNNSFNVVAGYGEKEIWVCGKSSYDGIIVSYCDAKSKFVRFLEIPPAIPIPGSALDRLLNDATLGVVAPGAATAGFSKVLADIAVVVAADATLAGAGGDSNIFSIATLKRVNEGEFHSSTFPCDRRWSWMTKTRSIPEDTELEPKYTSAMNLRQEHIRVWDRRDNWHNTIGVSYADFGVDRTWWFLSEAQEWRWSCDFLDTPIGSMMAEVPSFAAGLWYMSGVATPMSIYRRDSGLFRSANVATKQTARLAVQLYVVQRQGVTLWAKSETGFVKQVNGAGPYTCKVARDGVDSVGYVTLSATEEREAGKYLFEDLSDEEKAEIFEDRFYVSTTGDDGEAVSDIRGNLQGNRNEIEVLGAVDFWNDLKTSNGRRNPVDQERQAEFEASVNRLIQAFYSTRPGKVLENFNLDVRVC